MVACASERSEELGPPIVANRSLLRGSTMRLVDYFKSEFYIAPYGTMVDNFFDRAALVAYFGYLQPYQYDYAVQNIAMGVYINSTHFLTTHNPFRPFLQDDAALQRLLVPVIGVRRVERYSYDTYYGDEAYYRVECARPVAPIMNQDNCWHGGEAGSRRHSPVHDLLVIRINDTLHLKTGSFELSDPPQLSRNLPAGPIMAELAGREDVIEGDFKVGFVGSVNDMDVFTWRFIRRRVFQVEDNALVDCDEWLPRNWGHFLCTLNRDAFTALGSGALLVKDLKIFGLGSFMLKKGNFSIFVFTDVRPYRDLIYSTCVPGLDESTDNARIQKR